jgi:hypothetical protein
MAKAIGFWSYVRADDEADLGRIARLAKDVVAQYEMISGDTIELFVDVDDIKLGENWRNKIQKSLSTAVFFIPVITPRYFLSSACVSELRKFSRGAKRLGVDELIIPLIYVAVQEIDNENSDNEMIKLVKSFQYKDWRDLRYADVNSEEYRRGVSELALRLVESNRKLERVTSTKSAYLEGSKDDDELNDDSPGLIDVLSDAIVSLDKVPETLALITNEIVEIGHIMEEATVDIHRLDDHGKGYRNILAIATGTANRLSEPTEIIYSNSNIYATQIRAVDEYFQFLINNASETIEKDPDNKQSYCELFASIRHMTNVSSSSIENVNEMVSAIEDLEKLSRVFRPVGRQLRKALIIIIESTEISKEWLELVDHAEIDCNN